MKTATNLRETGFAIGNTGGPLVTEDGYIIDINTFGAVGGEGTNGTIYIDTLFPLYKQYNIPYILADQNNEKKVLNEADALVFSQPKANERLSAVMLAAIAGTIGIVIIIAAMTRPLSLQQQADEGYISLEPVLPQASKNPVLVGVSGEYAGKRFLLQYGKITMGKDIVFCHVIFDNSASDISSRHCEVSYNNDSGCFILIDLGLTFCTFSVEGRKMIPGIPNIMRSGESFYLATYQNKFIFEMEEGKKYEILIQYVGV